MYICTNIEINRDVLKLARHCVRICKSKFFTSNLNIVTFIYDVTWNLVHIVYLLIFRVFGSAYSLHLYSYSVKALRSPRSTWIRDACCVANLNAALWAYMRILNRSQLWDRIQDVVFIHKLLKNDIARSISELGNCVWAYVFRNKERYLRIKYVLLSFITFYFHCEKFDQPKDTNKTPDNKIKYQRVLQIQANTSYILYTFL